MELGQRIREARLAAGLSQRQLCGETITRNMLSLIENGSARPSMDTLRCLADRLGKPVSWFLEEQAVSSPNRECMALARESWQSGDPESALKALREYRSPDDTFDPERGLLLFLSCLSAAQNALQEGRVPYAVSLLKQAKQAESPYITDALLQALTLLLAKAGQPAQLRCDEALLARAEQTLATDPSRCLEILQAADDQASAQWLLLAGQARFALREYRLAAQMLTVTEPLFPQVIPVLEVCFRELGDYQKAYEYACKGRK